MTTSTPVKFYRSSSSKPVLPTNAPTLVTMFSGGGGIECGAVQAGIRPIASIEFDPIKPRLSAKIADTHDQNFSQYGCKTIRQDVREIASSGFPGIPRNPDFLHASPVCSNFSNAKGSKAIESAEDIAMANAVVQAIRVLKPRHFTLENVERYCKSESFKLIVQALKEEGYNWQSKKLRLLGCQTRDRLILWATKGLLPPFPSNPKPQGWYEVVKDLIPAMNDSVLVPGQVQSLEKFLASNEPAPLWIRRGKNGGEYRHSRFDKPIDTLTRTIFTDGKDSNRSRFADIWLPGGIVKQVSIAAVARLQGFPDWYQFPDSVAVAGSVIGYSVPPSFSAKLFNALKGEKPMKFTRLEMLDNEEQQLLQRLEEIKAKREPLALIVKECEGAIALITDLNTQAESIDHSLAVDFRSELIKALGLNLTLGGQEEASVWQDKLSKSEEAIASKNLEIEKLIAALEQVEEERDRIAKELKAAQETINQLEDALDQDQVEEQMYEMYGSDEITKDEIETGFKVGDKVKDTSRPDRGVGEIEEIRHEEKFPLVIYFSKGWGFSLRYELEDPNLIPATDGEVLAESDTIDAETVLDEAVPALETLILEKNNIVQIPDGRVCVVEYPAGELALLRHPDGTSANYRVASLKFISKGQKVAAVTTEEDNSDTRIKDLLDFKSAKQMMERTWQDVQVACKQDSKLTFRNLLLEVSSAKGRVKKFGDRLPELYAQYLFETCDESDTEWLPEQFVEQAKALEEEKRKSTSNTQVQQLDLVVEEANDQVPFDCQWAGDVFDAAHGCKGEVLGKVFADYKIRWHREDGTSFERREEPDSLTWVRPLKDSAA